MAVCECIPDHPDAHSNLCSLARSTQLTLEGRMENPGTWLYHCHVNHHIHAGMAALYLPSTAIDGYMTI